MPLPDPVTTHDTPSHANLEPSLHWQEQGQARQALWHAEHGMPAPKKLQVVDDTLSADAAHRLACEGTALLWRGDFENSRQLLAAMGRRIRSREPAPSLPPQQRFHLHRQAQAHRARILGMLLVELNSDYRLDLRRAPDVQAACAEALGPASGPLVLSLRELLGINGAHQWRKKGVWISALQAHIHPHYGVFSPVRGEYLDLVAQAPWSAPVRVAFDIGTGTGVLAAILAQRGVAQVVATELQPRALVCAQANVAHLGWAEQIQILAVDMFPPGRADLVVCNPPWIPARPSAAIEQAVYDPDSAMLRAFLAGLPSHLTARGEGWLILSDLAEHLGLRPRAELLAWIEQAGLQVIERLDVRPQHNKAVEARDALHWARREEVTSLWRLRVQTKAEVGLSEGAVLQP